MQKYIFNEYPFNLYIKMTAQRIKEINDRIFSEYGLNTSQVVLLWHIHKAIEQELTINRKFLEQTLDLSGATITNLLKKLEELEFITRKNSKKDSRNLDIDVTEKTKLLIKEVSDNFEKSEQILTNGMSEAEKAMFVSLLTRAYENINNAL